MAVINKTIASVMVCRSGENTLIRLRYTLRIALRGKLHCSNNSVSCYRRSRNVLLEIWMIMNHNYVVSWVEVCFTYTMFRNLALVIDFRWFIIVVFSYIFLFSIEGVGRSFEENI